MAPTGNRTYPSKPIAEKASWILGAITNPEFVAVVVFCVIGILLTLNFVLRLPDLSAYLID
jgi:hypothetical protein